jgi:hypothetical protein
MILRSVYLHVHIDGTMFHALSHLDLRQRELLQRACIPNQPMAKAMFDRCKLSQRRAAQDTRRCLLDKLEHGTESDRGSGGASLFPSCSASGSPSPTVASGAPPCSQVLGFGIAKVHSSEATLPALASERVGRCSHLGLRSRPPDPASVSVSDSDESEMVRLPVRPSRAQRTLTNPDPVGSSVSSRLSASGRGTLWHLPQLAALLGPEQWRNAEGSVRQPPSTRSASLLAGR